MSFCEAESISRIVVSMKSITLQSRPKKLELCFVFILSTTLFSVVAKEVSGHRITRDLIGSAVLGIAASLMHHWITKRMMRVDRYGIRITRHLFKSFSIPWHEIVSIGMADVRSIREGLHGGICAQHVGIQLHPLSPLRDSKQCQDNRTLSDFDVLIGAVYGMSVPRFAEFLARQKKRLYKPTRKAEIPFPEKVV
jgi:hypothetical protein